MNKIDFIVKAARNIYAEGMVPREAYILCAVAKLQGQGKEEVTSHDVGEVIGDSHVSSTMKRMTWWLNIRERKNALNKKTFYYSLSEKGTEKIERIIS
jgi:hypothetical protein